MNKILLHIEGLAVLLLSIYLYSYFQFNWVLFLVLLFAPDVAMVGYFINRKVGAVLYNIIHTYTLAILIIGCGWLLSHDLVLALGLILSAHIGMDRMVGYGLKYTTNFKDTHLNRV